MAEHVVVVDLSIRSGGTQRRIRDLVGRWPSSGSDLTVVLLAGSDLGRQLDRSRCTVVELGRRRWDPRLLVDLVRLFRRTGATLVDAHNVAAQCWAVQAAVLARVPRVVCTVHSNYEEEHAGTRRGGFYTAVLRTASRLGATFIAVSPGVARWLERLGISERRVRVVRNTLPSSPAVLQDRAVMRTRLGVSPDSFVIVCVARLEKVKRIDVLVDAVSKLVRSGVEAELLLVGDGSEFGALQAMAESLGVGERVHALGHRSDVFDVLAAADCFAMLSSTEGLPFAPLEATVLGLPLVLTRVGELPALIGEDAARFVPVGDRDAAAQALAELAGSATLRSTLGAIAATRASAALTADEFLPAMMAVYGTTEASRPLRSAAAALASSSLCRRTAHASARFSQRVLAAGSTLSVLTYHRVAEVGGAHLDPTLLSATPEEFDEQMRMLRSRFQPVDVHAVIAAIVGEQQLPPNAVHVSFDDGYRDVQRHAVPILERYGIPATLFVPTNYPDHPELDFWWDRLYRALAAAANRVCVTPAGTFVLDGRPAAAEAASRSIARYVKTLAHADAMDVVDDIVTSLGGTEPLNEVLGWDELAALSSAGVTIASHSRSHAALDGLPVEALDDELTGSRSDIERHLGSCPALFAYPTGQSSAAVRTQVRTAGYVAAFGTEAGINRLPVEDPLQLRRIDVGRRVDARLLEVLLSPLGRPLDRIR